MSFLKPELGTAGAAWAVSLTSVCAVLGRLAVGSFVDRVNRRAVIAGNFLLQATSVVLMLSGPGPMLLYVACAMFGLGVGNTTSLPSVIVQAEFPKAAFGRVVSAIIASRPTKTGKDRRTVYTFFITNLSFSANECPIRVFP